MLPQDPINAPAEFQRAVNEVFTILVNVGGLRFFADDAAFRAGE